MGSGRLLACRGAGVRRNVRGGTSDADRGIRFLGFIAVFMVLFGVLPKRTRLGRTGFGRFARHFFKPS